MSDNNSLRPYLMPAPRETPSSQLVVQRRPLPSSAPKRTAAQMDEDANQERPSTPPRRVPRRNARAKNKAAERSRAKRVEDEKNPPPSPPTPSSAFPTEYAVATHCTVVPGHGYIYYAGDRHPLFVPMSVMHIHHTPGVYTSPCHQPQAAGIVQMPGVQMPSIGAPANGYGGEHWWTENAWGYLPGFDLGDTSQMHGNFNFNQDLI
ncbi:uncharacterized protein BKA55DRAFT_542774 [Fusarium redolens]|uniref:Uncharacterized protein n=1 Tax=Fusarium redolens TaxID=48865 RepID=A0A9P9JX28_FUSRE|nr:uncharacterized protein BKA55DRAFT_542774 [Fusarium redolens]KAH7240178.1 hypothetical protein BKA55DRAFT_542774 [Fusarium redolens]